MGKLEKSTVQILAKALKLDSAGSSVQGSETYTLDERQAGTVRQHLNFKNPLEAYSRGLRASDKGFGSITYKWDKGDNPLIEKKRLANPDFKSVDEDQQTVYYNKPLESREGVAAFDLLKGATNELAYRADKKLNKFTRESIKEGFAELVKTGAVKSSIAIKASETLNVDKAREQMRLIIAGATDFLKVNKADKSLLTITVESSLFDNLAFAKLLGNAVTTTFAGGSYSIGTMGGYIIQSGESFLPQAGATIAKGDVAVFYGLDNIIKHEVDVINLSIGPIENLSKDQGAVIELVDINAVPRFVKEWKYASYITFT